MSRTLPFALLASLAFAAGCGPSGPRVMGSAPAGNPVSIAVARKADSGASLVVAGEMVEKCPVAGCWFEVRDGSGTLRVDTKNAGFVVLDVPLHSRITVVGRVQRSGGEPQFEATGVRY